jgi:hypothetical protein
MAGWLVSWLAFENSKNILIPFEAKQDNMIDQNCIIEGYSKTQPKVQLILTEINETLDR